MSATTHKDDSIPWSHDGTFLTARIIVETLEDMSASWPRDAESDFKIDMLL